ncbi:MAG: aminopeptidase P family N-terminal domain-containing protein, partial [Candidatus Omnitrophica bacterium]|nr:aminopeptidase P family N-terminal domain-containing protein [Candidatus Omnitrophota bacterium]
MNCIPDVEYRERIKKFQKNIRAAGLDAALVHSNEADFANVRYLSEYWPTFSSGGVFVPAKGKPVLLIGLESENYARQRSKIKQIKMLVEYRESADPEYPGIKADTFKDVVKKAMPSGRLKKLGLVGSIILPLPVYEGLKKDLPGVKLVKSDMTLLGLRIIKSDNEIKLMKKAFKISEKAIDAIL